MKTGERCAQRKALSGIIIVFLILFLFNGQSHTLRADGIHKGSLTEKDKGQKVKIQNEISDFSSLYPFNICDEEEENECSHVVAINAKDSSENSCSIEYKHINKYLSHRKYLLTNYPLYLLNQSLLI